MQRGPGAPQRDRHRLVTVFLATEFLAEPRDEQERVIGAGTEDQHREDAGALGVDGEPGMHGQQVDQRLRDCKGDTGAASGSSQSTGLR